MAAPEASAVGRVLGVEPGVVALEPLPAISSDRRRLYRAEVAGARYFVKARALRAGRADRLVRALGGLPPPCLRVPRFFGRAGDVEVWEYVEGTRKRLAAFDPGELAGLVEALVATELAAGTSDLPATNWMWPVAARIRSMERPRPVRAWARLLGRAEPWERALIGRSLGGCLVHNDLHGGNVLWTGQRWCVVDWDKASLGAPGGSLRAFAATPRAGEAARLYAEARTRGGAPADPEEVLFVMAAHQAMSDLQVGYWRRDRERIERGRALARRLVPGVPDG